MKNLKSPIFKKSILARNNGAAVLMAAGAISLTAIALTTTASLVISSMGNSDRLNGRIALGQSTNNLAALYSQKILSANGNDPTKIPNVSAPAPSSGSATQSKVAGASLATPGSSPQTLWSAPTVTTGNTQLTFNICDPRALSQSDVFTKGLVTASSGCTAMAAQSIMNNTSVGGSLNMMFNTQVGNSVANDVGCAQSTSSSCMAVHSAAKTDVTPGFAQCTITANPSTVIAGQATSITPNYAAPIATLKVQDSSGNWVLVATAQGNGQPISFTPSSANGTTQNLRLFLTDDNQGLWGHCDTTVAVSGCKSILDTTPITELYNSVLGRNPTAAEINTYSDLIVNKNLPIAGLASANNKFT